MLPVLTHLHNSVKVHFVRRDDAIISEFEGKNRGSSKRRATKESRSVNKYAKRVECVVFSTYYRSQVCGNGRKARISGLHFDWLIAPQLSTLKNA